MPIRQAAPLNSCGEANKATKATHGQTLPLPPAKNLFVIRREGGREAFLATRGTAETGHESCRQAISFTEARSRNDEANGRRGGSSSRVCPAPAPTANRIGRPNADSRIDEAARVRERRSKKAPPPKGRRDVPIATPVKGRRFSPFSSPRGGLENVRKKGNAEEGGHVPLLATSAGAFAEAIPRGSARRQLSLRITTISKNGIRRGRGGGSSLWAFSERQHKVSNNKQSHSCSLQKT